MFSVSGVIERRLLLNFRVDASAAQAMLPEGMKPKLYKGRAIAGICLIRLSHMHPKGLPVSGPPSENMAHRIAVLLTEGEGVYIPQRFTNSTFNRLLGGRLFPGEHRAAAFEVGDDGEAISMTVRHESGEMLLALEGSVAEALPTGSVFTSLDEASEFFRQGAVGLSPKSKSPGLDGLELRTENWQVKPFTASRLESAFVGSFPASSIEFDHALVMRQVRHEWVPQRQRQRTAL